MIHVREAIVLATYGSEFYQGMPALTKNKYGKGVAYYQAFRDTGAFFGDVCDGVLAELKIEGALGTSQLPCGVTAHKRTDGKTEYLFVENYSELPVYALDLRGEWMDMELGTAVKNVNVSAFGVKILKKCLQNR